MKDRDKTQKQSSKELSQLRRRIVKLEAAGHKRNQLDEALRMERDKAQHYLDVAEVMLVALNKKGEITLINRKGNQILGYKEGELLGRNWFIACVPAYRRKKLKSGFLKLMAGKIKLTEFYEDPALTKSGTERIIAWHNSLLKDAHGSPIGTLSSGEDITGLKQAQEALKQKTEESELQYRTTLNSMGDAIHVIDKNLRFVLFNDAFKRWNEELGLETNVTGQAVAEVFPFLPKKISNEYRHVFKTGQPLITEEKTKLNGREFITETRKIPIFEGSKVARIATIIRNITERKQAENEIRESKQMLEKTFSSLRDALLIIDASRLKILDCNPAASEIFGYDRNEMIGQTVKILHVNKKMNEEFRNRLFAAIEKQGFLSRFEFKMKRKDGTIFATEHNVTPLEDDQGNRSLWVSIVRDITERKRSEERYQTIIHTAMDGFVLVDMRGNFKDANEAYCNMIGYSRDELLNMAIPDVEAIETAKETAAHLRKIKERGYDRFETHQRRKDGEIIDVEVSAKYAPTDGGQLIGFYRDITERKRLQETLDNERMDLKLIIDSTPVRVFFKDKEGKYIRVNKTYAEGLEMPEEDFVGKTVFDLYSPQIAQGMTADDQDVLQSGRPKLNIIEQYESASGTRWVQTDKIPIFDIHGMISGLIGFAQDITERRQAEEERERALRETRLRFEISQALASTQTEDEVLDALISHAGLYPQAYVAILTFDKQEDEVACIVRRSRPFESGVMTIVPIGERFPIAKFTIVNLHINGQEFVSDDTFSDERVDPNSREIFNQIETASLAIFPLGNGNEMEGLIVAVAKPPNFFDEDKQRLYRTLAEQGTVALRAARLRGQIRESQQRFQGLVETLSDWIWEIDENGRYTYVGPRVKYVLGFEPEEILGKTPFDLMPPEEAERVKAIFEPLLAARQPLVTLENSNRHKDGRLVVFETSGAPFFDVKGQYKGYRGVDRDITERKQTEAALRERQETINAIIDTSQDWIWAIDSQGVHTYSNPAIEKILGYRADEIVGNISFNLIHDDDKKWAESLVQECRQKRCGWNNLLLRWRHKNGTYRYLESNAVPILNTEGELAGFRGVDRDITERKQAEEAFRQSEEKYRTILESIEEGYYEVDLAGNYTFFNDAMSRIAGYPPEEMMGMNDRQYTSKETARNVYKKYNEVYTTGKPGKGYEYEVIRKDGTKRYVEVSAALRKDASGKKLGFRGIARDITERKQTETALRESEERYRRLVDNSLLGIGISRGDHIVFANPALLRLFGYDDLTEFTEIPLLNSVAPSSHQLIVERMKNVSQGKPLPAEFEFDILRKDGLIKTVQANSQHFTLDDKTYTQTTFHDITDRKRADSLIRIRLRLLEFAATHSLAELLQKTLDEVCEFTTSSVGFYHFVNKDQKTLSLQAWSTKTIKEFCKAEGTGMHYSIDEAGVWVDCVRKRSPVIHNNYASLPHRKGMPEGHAAIVRELVVPIMRNDRFVAVLGIGNKPQDYTEQDVQSVSYIADVAWEIAERKRAREELEESEKKYRQVVENATEIIYTTDINGNFTYANPIALKVTGFLLEELQQYNYLDLVVPEYRDRLKEIYGNQFRSRQATTYVEFPFTNKFGEVMWFSQNSSLMIEDDKITGFQIIARDISERKQAEEALQKSEEKYRDLVENISDIIYATDETGIVTYISPSIEPVGGYTPSEVIGRSFLEFVYQDDMSDVVQFFNQDISGQAAPHEYRMVAKAGDVRWVRVSSRPFFEGARIVGLRGILTDITERKRAEEQVKRSYEQLQETLHSTVKALASTVEMKDQYTAGHQPRVTQLACAIAEEMGLSQEQIEGIRMAASIHDIGKIMVPAEILNKPGRLTEIQYEMIKMHPRAGYDILKGLKLPWPVAQIILQHHERMDGSGYPQGLSGEKIMLEARILAVANVVEAMNAHRPYRPAYDIKEALAEISKNKGTFYDSAVVDACLRLFKEKGFVLDSLPR